MTSEALAMLGMAGAATSAVFAAAGFVIVNAVRVGRHLERFEVTVERVEAIDGKLERHIEWHHEERAEAPSQ